MGSTDKKSPYDVNCTIEEAYEEYLEGCLRLKVTPPMGFKSYKEAMVMYRFKPSGPKENEFGPISP